MRRCALVHCCVLAFAAVSHAETIDRVLAVVSGQVIMLSDVNAARELGLRTPVDAGSADPIRPMLNALIDRQLVLTEVERYSPAEPAADAIEREMARVRGRFATAEAFASALARSGITEKDMREILRQDLRIAAYLDQRFAAAQARRQALMDDWLAGLRNRSEIVDLYLTRD
jgi:hypothetical protein